MTRNLADEQLTRSVLASFENAQSKRFRTVAQSLIRHLHDFVEEVQLSEEEWSEGIDFLTRTGHVSDDRRQEFILLSDVLGVSMLVIGINNRKPPEATQATVFGPFFVGGAPRFENGGDLGQGAPGEPCFMSGRVLSTRGGPVPGARIDVWQADEDGFYDVQYEGLEEPRGRGHLLSDAEGRFWFWSVLPEAYPIPADGPVGELLAAGARSLMRPAHVHFRVSARGYERLITHVFADGDPYLDSDAVFGVKSSLIAPFERHEPGIAPDGSERDSAFYTLAYDLVLVPTG
ncbi:MAG TPA: intradiol ring-cleavage dioxygenase [Thermoleophilaceae bacterium]|nr:intradiol ring-cleavage dioxygenase [Thermoleophilaceae bacterium]